jgi:serine protease Do
MISHGSSGSPVCNERGEVIGLATFGSLEQGSGNLASGYNFAIPVSVIKDFLKEGKIQPQLPQVSVFYNQALDLYYRAYYNKALKKFEDVKKINSNYPRLNYYMALSNKKIEAGEDKNSFMQKNFLRIISFILIIGGVYIYYRWKTGKD